MITFKQFLSEAEKRDLVEFLRGNCRQACEDIVAAKNRFFYRGISNVSSNRDRVVWMHEDQPLVGVMRYVRKDRVARDTPEWAHEEINKFIDKKFGVRLRSEGLFVFNRESSADGYGTPHIILPIGQYSCYWAEHVSDLTMLLFPDMDAGEDSGLAGGEVHWRHEIGKTEAFSRLEVSREMEKDYIQQALEAHTWQKGSAVDALKADAEIIIVCNRYIGVHYSHEDALLEAIHEALSE